MPADSSLGEAHADEVLTAYVHIDDRVAAALARALISSFGFLADRKLAEAADHGGRRRMGDRPIRRLLRMARGRVDCGRPRARVMAALPACARGVAQSGDAR